MIVEEMNIYSVSRNTDINSIYIIILTFQQYQGNLAEWLWRQFQAHLIQNLLVRKSEGSNPSVVKGKMNFLNSSDIKWLSNINPFLRRAWCGLAWFEGAIGYMGLVFGSCWSEL